VTAPGRVPTAVVTGGGSGIGAATALALAAAGHCVVVGDLAVIDPVATHPDITAVLGDLSAPGAAADLVSTAAGRHGRVDVLVNNLGISPHREGFEKTTDEDWARTFEINLFVPIRATRAALPWLTRSGGVIVNVTSALAREPMVTMPDYCASKAALAAMTRMIADEFGPDGVRCLAVAPGPTLTGQWTGPGGQLERQEAATGTSREELLRGPIPRQLGLSLGRLAEPGEVAEVITFLTSGAAAAMTGTTVTVDGGMLRGVG